MDIGFEDKKGHNHDYEVGIGVQEEGGMEVVVGEGGKEVAGEVVGGKVHWRLDRVVGMAFGTHY